MPIEIEGIKIFFAALQAGKPRRDAEKEAVAQLMAEAFGADARIEHDASGRPLVSGASISVSHSRTLAALAVAPEGISVGIDVEDSQDRASRVIRRVLRGPYSDAYSNALEAWTLLEAAFKCTLPNEGLTLVDYELPAPSGGIEGKNIVLTKRPEVPLRIVLCRPSGIGGNFVSVVAGGQSLVP